MCHTYKFTYFLLNFLEYSLTSQKHICSRIFYDLLKAYLHFRLLHRNTVSTMCHTQGLSCLLSIFQNIRTSHLSSTIHFSEHSMAVSKYAFSICRSRNSFSNMPHLGVLQFKFAPRNSQMHTPTNLLHYEQGTTSVWTQRFQRKVSVYRQTEQHILASFYIASSHLHYSLMLTHTLTKPSFSAEICGLPNTSLWT